MQKAGLRLVPTDWLLLGWLFFSTWAKLSWSPLGRLALTDLIEAALVAAVAWRLVREREARVPRVAGVLALFALGFLCVYLIGAFNLFSADGQAQWLKGMVKWSIHATAVIAAAIWLVRRGPRLFELGLGAFVAGISVNAVYAWLQMGVQYGLGLNTDRIFLQPIFNGATIGADLYGRVTQVTSTGTYVTSSVYRATGFGDDPNHLGVELIVPIAILLALVIGSSSDWVRRHRARLVALGTFLFLTQLLTGSRSGLLGTVGVLAVLAVIYGRRLVRRELVIPVLVVLALGGAFAAAKPGYVSSVIQSRLQTQNQANGKNTHFDVYGLIGPILDQRPLAGLGLNNFSVEYAWETGRENFGPHSAYVLTITETGIIGALWYLGYLSWVAGQALALLRAGRAGAAEDEGLRHAIAAGLLAALAGTLVGNLFYLTTVFNYWYLLLLLCATSAAVLAPRPTRSALREAPALGEAQTAQ